MRETGRSIPNSATLYSDDGRPDGPSSIPLLFAKLSPNPLHRFLQRRMAIPDDLIRGLVGGERLLETTEDFQEFAKVGIGLPIAGIEGNRRLVILKRLPAVFRGVDPENGLDSPQEIVRHSPFQVGVGGLGFQSKRAVEIPDRLFQKLSCVDFL